MKTLNLVAVMLTLTVSSILGESKWAFDMAHSKVGFSVTHLVISEVEGQFNEFDGSVVTVNEDFENAKVEFSANIASINTENEQRDNHLKSDDFFNAEKYPKMAFIGKSFKKVDENNYKLVGELTIRDVTKEVELDVTFNGIVEDPWGNTKAGFKATGMINRFDYNLTWNKAIETGGLVASEDVSIILNIQLLKK